jgi:hypothetical protein
VAADEAVYLGRRIVAGARAIEAPEEAAEEAVLVGFCQFLLPELVDVENVLVFFVLRLS